MRIVRFIVKKLWALYQWADQRWELSRRGFAAACSWLAGPAAMVAASTAVALSGVVSITHAASLLVLCLASWPLVLLGSPTVRGWCKARQLQVLFRLRWEEFSHLKLKLRNTEFGSVKFAADGNLQSLVFKPGVQGKMHDLVAEILRIEIEPAYTATYTPVPGRPDWINVSTSGDSLPDLVALTADRISKTSSKVYMGQCSSNQPLIWDVNAAYHMLIAGKTGKGKGGTARSILIHAVAHSETWDAVVVSAKNSGEFKWFTERGGQVCAPVQVEDTHSRTGMTTDPSPMVDAIAEAHQMVMERTVFMQEKGYESWQQAMNSHPELKRHLVFIDEFKTMMNALSATTGVAKEDKINAHIKAAVVRAVQDIAATARTAGVHLVIATQKADVDAVGGGSTLNNLDARVVTSASSKATEQALDELPEAGALSAAPGRVYHKNLDGISDSAVQGQIGWVEPADIPDLLEAFTTTDAEPDAT